MDNPNPYDDGRYVTASLGVSDSLGDLWDAGASIENIESEVANGLENALIDGPTVGVPHVAVNISVTWS